MTGDEIKAAAVEVHNACVELGKAFEKLNAGLDECRKSAFAEGGENAVLDFQQYAGRERIKTDLIGLMMAAGLEPILIASQGHGRSRWKSNPNFGQRYAELVDSGKLATTRGRANFDAVSPYPGQKVKR
jgi:hypothetical protein